MPFSRVLLSLKGILITLRQTPSLLDRAQQLSSAAPSKGEAVLVSQGTVKQHLWLTKGILQPPVCSDANSPLPL